jgi:hypothetical protein
MSKLNARVFRPVRLAHSINIGLHGDAKVRDLERVVILQESQLLLILPNIRFILYKTLVLLEEAVSI